MKEGGIEGWDICVFMCVCVYIYIYIHIYIVMIDSPCMTEINKHCKAIILQLKKKRLSLVSLLK